MVRLLRALSQRRFRQFGMWLSAITFVFNLSLSLWRFKHPEPFGLALPLLALAISTMAVALSTFALVLHSGVEAFSATPKVERTAPRWCLLMLAYLSPPAEREAMVGDAEEMFHSAVERFGPRHAKMLLLCDVARSSIHLIGRALRKSVVWAFAYFCSAPPAK